LLHQHEIQTQKRKKAKTQKTLTKKETFNRKLGQEREKERAMETRKEFLKWRYTVKKDEFWGGNVKQKRERRSFRSCNNHPKKLPKKSKLFNRSQKGDCSPIVEKSEFSSSLSLGSVKTRRK
jgi:hypothetical protein